VILHLLQPLEPKVADAIEIVVGEVRRRHDLVNKLQTGFEKPIERGQRDDDGVHARFEIEIAADAGDAIGNIEG
jgi:hypothetical protein